MKDEGLLTPNRGAPPGPDAAVPSVLRPSSFVLRHRVRYRECDSMGVVYHTHYLDWFEAARTEALRDLGLAYRELEAEGIFMPVVEASIHYHGAARYDDLVDVEVTLTPPAGVRVQTEYAVRVHGETRQIVTGRVVLVFMDADRRRPVAAPDRVRALFQTAAVATR